MSAARMFNSQACTPVRFFLTTVPCFDIFCIMDMFGDWGSMCVLRPGGLRKDVADVAALDKILEAGGTQTG